MDKQTVKIKFGEAMSRHDLANGKKRLHMADRLFSSLLNS
jgi:hypothetical protein